MPLLRFAPAQHCRSIAAFCRIAYRERQVFAIHGKKKADFCRIHPKGLPNTPDI